jgi:hypothetical protein
MIRRGARIAWCVIFILPFYAKAVNGEMTYAQYEKELATLEQREKNAKEQIASEQAHRENLKNQIIDITEKNTAARKALYDILGITENDVIAANAEIASIRRQLEVLIHLSSDEVKNRQKEIDAQQSRITALKKMAISHVWKIRDQLPPVEQFLEQLKTKAALQAPVQATALVSPAAQSLQSYSASYTVRFIPGSHESLFQIAAKDSVYGDPEKWTLLYRSNKAKIDEQYQMYLKRNPGKKYLHPEDLIFPGQILAIPR